MDPPAACERLRGGGPGRGAPAGGRHLTLSLRLPRLGAALALRGDLEGQTAGVDPSPAVRPSAHSSSSGSGPFGSESIGQFGRSWRSRAAIVAIRAAFAGSLATL